MAFIDVDVNHDGVMFKPALDVAEGRILFKESYSLYGALTIIIQATALTIFGKYLIVIKLLPYQPMVRQLFVMVVA
jgi:hypothetical protein